MNITKQLIENCELGDKVLLTNGDVYEFVRLKRTKFIGSKDGRNYNIPVQMFVEIVGKAEKKDISGYKTLKKNELFYIVNSKQQPIVFKFAEISNGRIIGFNPITNTQTRIDVSLYGGKISSL